MKKIICLLLVLIMTSAVFFGCAGTPGGSDGKDTSKTPGKTDPASTNGQAGTSDPAAASEYEALAAGDRFTFGKWEQDGKKGAEPISWIVLRQDVGKMLVLTENVLEYTYFKNPTDEENYPRALYKDSDLRAFLNGEFYENAFTSDEKSLIGASKITTNYKDESYNELTYETEDKVFALSKDEAARYVCGVGSTVFGIPTKRVAEENPYRVESVSGVDGVEQSIAWWLRDMGVDSNKYAAYIKANAPRKYNNDETVYNKSGIRPAMWITYNEKVAKAYEKGEIQPKEDADLNARIAALKVGDKLQFGVYDNNLYSIDGFEALVWTVIDEDDAGFLIITDTWAGKSYSVFDNKNADETSWAASSLHSYINSAEFLDMTFTVQEKSKLILTHVVSTGEDDRSGGDATDDLLFIPDITEINKYFGESGGIGAKYWLRSQQSWAPYMAYVDGSGSVSSARPSETYSIRLMARIAKS